MYTVNNGSSIHQVIMALEWGGTLGPYTNGKQQPTPQQQPIRSEPAERKITMAILIMADVPNQTQEGYDGVLAMVEPLLKEAPGFVMHAAYPAEGGWKSIEVWESKAAATEFFAKHIAPNLPPGVKPKRTIQELYSLVCD